MMDSLGLSGPSSVGLVLRTLGYTALASVGYFVVRMYQARMQFRRLQKEHGVPMLPHSFLFGHLWALAKMSMKQGQPPDVHGQWLFLQLQREHPTIVECGLVYLDLWPIMYPMLTVFQPEMQSQFTQVDSQPKFWAQGQKEFKHYTNGEDLVNLEGREWKQARAMFNPGFSAKNLLSLVPDFVEETLVFRERLREAAESGRVVKLEELTTNVTVDVIGRAVLGTRFHQQTRPNPLIQTLNRQLAFISLAQDLRKELHPLRHITHWICNRSVRQQLTPSIQHMVQNHEKVEGPKTILSLAAKTFLSEEQGSPAKGSTSASFIDRTINHIKIFVFAGHDTSATTLAYVYWLMYKHPDKAKLLCAELDEVLGSDPVAAAEKVSADPTILNRLPYALAVYKETLRLFPPVGGTIRQTGPDFFLVHPDTGVRYPTHGFMVHSSTSTIGRDPRYWPEADAFIPERWLVRDENDPMYPRKNVWRPFEVGPRNCIGQELVSLEIRLIVALTMREFDIESAYKENAPEWKGEKAYQIETRESSATAHIKDKMPVRVKFRSMST